MLLTESAEIFRTLSYPGRLTGTEVLSFTVDGNGYIDLQKFK